MELLTIIMVGGLIVLTFISWVLLTRLEATNNTVEYIYQMLKGFLDNPLMTKEEKEVVTTEQEITTAEAGTPVESISLIFAGTSAREEDSAVLHKASSAHGGIRNCSPVKCVTTGRSFMTQKSAEKFYKLKINTIYHFLSGHTTSGGTHPVSGNELTWVKIRKEEVMPTKYNQQDLSTVKEFKETVGL